MKLYRFSPIKNQQQLLEAIKHTHIACHQLCRQSFGQYLPTAGNIGIFCHYDDEYERLTKLREQLTDSSDNWNQKYYRLHKPITIPAEGDIPETTYTYLYIRKPDPYRHHVGDVDFCLDPTRYATLKQSLADDKTTKGARLYPGPNDMIELHNPDIDACGYVVTKMMSEKFSPKEKA